MNELIQKIEQWADDRNIIKGSKPIDQAMKLFSEFGELADNVGKGRDCRDDIGDILVVLTIISKQMEIDINFSINRKSLPLNEEIKILVARLSDSLTTIALHTQEDRLPIYALNDAVSWLKLICLVRRYTLKECLEIAYNDIKDRHGYMRNGIFIKLSDMTSEDREEYEKSKHSR